MALTLTITAENAEDLRTQLHVLLGAAVVTALAKALEKAPAEPSAAPVPSQEDIDAKKPDPAEITEEKQEVKKRRAHRKVKAEPSGAPEPSHDDGAPATPNGSDAADEISLTDTSDEDIFAGFDPVAAQKVKDEVLPQLRDLFVAGKVKQVRAILDKFGDGAKSIPEIEAKQFPAIRDFLAQGASA